MSDAIAFVLNEDATLQNDARLLNMRLLSLFTDEQRLIQCAERRLPKPSNEMEVEV